MEKAKVDVFLQANANKFRPEMLVSIQEKLYNAPDDRYIFIAGMNFWDPTVILVIAILLGWDRFFLNDIGLGILKVITCYGVGIWWLIDIFTAQKRTYEYNYKKLMVALGEAY